MTLFPDMCNAVLSESIIGRARQAGKVEINCVDIRNYTLDKHRRVDDKPYGGGMGMIMAPQPIYDCYKAICEDMGAKPHLIYLTPQGKTLTQQRVKELSKLDNLVLLCGHYEGIDERVIEELDPEEISVGDYVLTGGELPALILADSVSRMLPGVLSDDECFEEESHLILFLNILNILIRQAGTVGMCLKYFFQVITQRLMSGAAKNRLNVHIDVAQICSNVQNLIKKTKRFCRNLKKNKKLCEICTNTANNFYLKLTSQTKLKFNC